MSDVKFIKSLSQRKFREEYGLFVVEGRKMLVESLNSNYVIENIYITKERLASLESEINRFIGSGRLSKQQIVIIKENDLNRMSSMVNPDGVLATIKRKNISHPAEYTKNDREHDENNLMLALDGINNPGNLGTIIRTSAWFGIKDIICSENTVDYTNPKVLQSTMGAIFYVNIIYTDIVKFIRDADIKNVYGTILQKGKNIYEQKLSNNGIIVIGSESHGISDEVGKLITTPITIPTFNKNSCIESLNAAVATGIVLSIFKEKSL